jgi:sugar phosphate isomerase/epimerase
LRNSGGGIAILLNVKGNFAILIPNHAMQPLNNPIWVMSSAFPGLSLEQVIEKTVAIGAQGLDLCVFRRDGTRTDHIATHLDYERFTPDTARRIIDTFNGAGLSLSVGAFENLIGGDPGQRRKNQDHLLRLIRMAHLLGGDANGVKVGTFVGYNHELGAEEGGFPEKPRRVRKGVCAHHPLRRGPGRDPALRELPDGRLAGGGLHHHVQQPTGVLAARKLMYALIPSRAHGEIYDPSHDVWQHTNPADVIRETDMSRLHRIHVKATRNLQNRTRTHWGSMYPVQTVDPELARQAGIPLPAHDWDRHNYEAMMPGFGGSDSMDWREFVEVLHERGFEGAFEMENEANNSKGTGNLGATVQGFRATVGFLAPMLWPLGEEGYAYDRTAHQPLSESVPQDIPLCTMDDLGQ